MPECVPVEEDLFNIDNRFNQFMTEAQGIDLYSDYLVPELAHLNALDDGLMKFNSSLRLSDMEMILV